MTSNTELSPKIYLHSQYSPKLQSFQAIPWNVCTALKKALVAEGFNFAWNEGAVAGQTVPHFNLHIVPRTTGDSGIWEYEPREFLYRPGSRAASP